MSSFQLSHLPVSPPFADYAKATATQKAVEVATRLEEDERVPFMIIGADTVVEAPDGSIMEKPKARTVVSSYQTFHSSPLFIYFVLHV